MTKYFVKTQNRFEKNKPKHDPLKNLLENKHFKLKETDNFNDFL